MKKSDNFADKHRVGAFYALEMKSREPEFSMGITTVSFDNKQLEYGKSILKKMSVPEDKQIVCIFARDSSFLSEKYPGVDWSYHDYRNCDIKTYLKAIDYLIKNNYMVIRVGSEYSPPLGYKNCSYIEYNLSDYKSEFMDLYLIYISSFVVGTTSGATDLATIFNIPFLGVNYAPFCEFPVGMNDMFIQKKLVDLSGNIVPFKSVIGKEEYFLFDGNKMLSEFGLSYSDNTEQEIYNAVVEMDKMITGIGQLSDFEKELLEDYHNEYCAKSAWSKKKAPISCCWLADNIELYL